MLKRLGEFVVKKRWWVIAAWAVIGGLIIGFAPRLSNVESSNQSDFLPKNYESVQASDIASRSFKSGVGATDIVVFKNKDGSPLSTADLQKVQEITGQVTAAGVPHVKALAASPQQISPNKKVQLGTVIYDGGAEQGLTLVESVPKVRGELAKATENTNLSAQTTGELAIISDTENSFQDALRIVSIATILLVLILPALVFRSPLIGLLPVAVVGLVYSIGSGLVAWVAQALDFNVSQQLSVLFTVVLYGVGTDYILFLLFRYRERLRSGDHSRGAVSFAVSRAGEAIVSAALVVMTSFVAMFFSKFGIFSSFAPSLVIMVAVMLLAVLTLVPAIIAVIGEKLFWPSKSWMSHPAKPTVSKRIGGWVARYPAAVLSVVIVVLGALAAVSLGYKADFGSFSEPPADTQSAAAYDDIKSAFPAGVLNPTQVYITSPAPFTPAQIAVTVQKLKNVQGVATPMQPAVSADGTTLLVPLVLKDNPYTNEALDVVGGPLRTAAHAAAPKGGEAYVGGVTSAFVDVRDVTSRDLKVIFPVAALFILIILALLLRSIVAPLYLLLSVSLGFIATLGASVLAFMNIGGNAGLIFFLPIVLYVFVVAIGTDYNILTITRLREEVREGNEPRKAALLTIEHSSATVASAGLILAGTFASLMLAGIDLLSQMGFAIAIGVVISAFIVAPLLIPSVSALLGRSVWWPSKISTRRTRSKK